MLIKEFSIPQPIITSPSCEYFIVRYKKTSPVESDWIVIEEVHGNSFILELYYGSKYKIEATHYCCNGSISTPTTITYDTSTGNSTKYVCLTETTTLDTCRMISGTCRSCKVQKLYRVDIYSDSSGTTKETLTESLTLKFQNTVNGVEQDPYDVIIAPNRSGGDLWVKTTYEETCSNNVSTVSTLEVNILDGSYEEYPYQVISCISNNPTLKEISNITTSALLRTQIFAVGDDILAGNKFYVTIYGYTVTVTAVTGDTPTSIASRLASKINSTPTANWISQDGLIGGISMGGFSPKASYSGRNLTIVLNYRNEAVAGTYYN